MKAEGKTWAEIGQAVGGRSKNTVNNRWKQLTKGDGGDGGAKKESGADAKDKGKADSKNGDGGKEKKAEDKKVGKKEAKVADEKKPSAKTAPSKASSKSSSEARFTKGEWMTLMEDDLFSFGELQCLSELLVQDDRQRWLRIASRFSDKTGRKVHPEDIRDKFAEMSRR